MRGHGPTALVPAGLADTVSRRLEDHGVRGVEGLAVTPRPSPLFPERGPSPDLEARGYMTGPVEGRKRGVFHGTGRGVGLDIHEPHESAAEVPSFGPGRW